MRRSSVGIVAMACLGLAACDLGIDLSGLGEPGPDRSEPEQKGIPLLNYAAGHAPLSWTPDGAGIVFVTRSGDQIVRVAVGSGSRSQLGTAPAKGGRFESALPMAQDGFAYGVWTEYDPNGTHTRYLLDFAGRTAGDTVRSGVGGMWLKGLPTLRLPGAGGIAFVAGDDSLFIRAGDGAVRFVATGCEGLMASSPAGDAVVCTRQVGYVHSYARVDLASGTSVAALPALDPHAAQGVHVVRWAAAGLGALYRSGMQFFILDPGAATGRPVSRPYPYDEAVFLDPAWSPDGGRVALWLSVCVQTQGWGCGKRQMKLLLLDASKASGNESVLAIHNGGPDLGPGNYLTFSPDGKQLGYVYGEALYVVTLP